MDEDARFERLLEAVDDLRAANESAPILVEGARDVASLRALGCRGKIVQIHDGRTLHDAFEALAREHAVVILMTDWDRKGRRFRKEATRLLEANGARADATLRDRLREFVDVPLNGVESLASYVAKGLERRFEESLDDHVERTRGHAHARPRRGPHPP